MDIPQIQPEAAKKLLESQQARYLDVRTAGEFHQGHVPGAINIPIAELDPATGRLQANPDFVSAVQAGFPKGKQLIVGCQSGGRSMAACELLIDAGYTNLHNLDGGFGGVIAPSGQVIQEGWATLGYPIERGSVAAKS